MTLLYQRFVLTARCLVRCAVMCLLVLATVVAMLVATHAPAVAEDAPPEACQGPVLQAEGPPIYLLTMPPGDALWNAFGHNALLVYDPQNHTTSPWMTYNFGAFEVSHRLLIDWLRGEQIFLLGVRTYEKMLAYYAREDRSIHAQRLDLPPKIARRLASRLRHQLKGPDRYYKYHWFQDNCSTRIRDLLNELTEGDIAAQHQSSAGVTPRSEILRHAAMSPWLWMTLDFIVGPGADNRVLSRWDTMFLSDRLARLTDQTTVLWPDGVRRPLVAHRCSLRTGTHDANPADTPPDWRWLLLLVSSLSGATLVALGRWARRASNTGRRALGVGFLSTALILGGLGSLNALIWAMGGVEAFRYSTILLLANPATLIILAALGGRLLRCSKPWPARRARLLMGALCGVGVLGVLVHLLIANQANTTMHLFAFVWLLGATVAAWQLPDAPSSQTTPAT